MHPREWRPAFERQPCWIAWAQRRASAAPPGGRARPADALAHTGLIPGVEPATILQSCHTPSVRRPRAQTGSFAVTSTSGRGHVRADIQGLRAVAVLLVMAYHAGLPISGGFIGVDVFFVVSGFVITGLLLRELAASGRVSLGRFYARRVRRLLPALALVTSVTAILAWALLPLQRQSATGRTGVAASVFLGNVEIMRSTGGYFDAAAEGNPLLHTWSLSVEEQFYLAFPPFSCWPGPWGAGGTTRGSPRRPPSRSSSSPRSAPRWR